MAAVVVAVDGGVELDVEGEPGVNSGDEAPPHAAEGIATERSTANPSIRRRHDAPPWCSALWFAVEVMTTPFGSSRRSGPVTQPSLVQVAGRSPIGRDLANTGLCARDRGARPPGAVGACFDTFGKEALADFAVYTPLEISARQWETSWRGDPMFLAR
jgi:hypothetical protein